MTPNGTGAKTPEPVNHLHGYKDHIPSDASYWESVTTALVRLARDYGYVNLETPILEEKKLFTLKGIHVVPEQQLQMFEDRPGHTVILRPENTLPLARAYREHGLQNSPQPVKLWHCGPQFRNEEPTWGTYRQFTQAGYEVFGDPQPIVDAQLIAAVYFVFQELGIGVQLRLNSIGHDVCRTAYTTKLTDYYRTRRSELCDTCKANLGRRTLDLLTCPVPECQELFNQAPQIVDHLCEPDRDHFVKVLEHLDEVDVSYQLEPRLIRDNGIASRTIVEFCSTVAERQSVSLARGGRHDKLVEAVGGPETACFGITIGCERMVLALKESGQPLTNIQAPDVFLAHLGDAARRKALQLFLHLRAEGIHVAESLSQDGIKGQLESATRQRAKYALILGQKEMMDGTILIRDMENGIQEVCDVQKVIPEINKRLAKRSQLGPAVVQPFAAEPEHYAADHEGDGEELSNENEQASL